MKNESSSKRNISPVSAHASRDSFHAAANQTANALSANTNSPEIIQRTIAEVPNHFQTIGSGADLFRINRLCLPGTDFGFAKRPIVEVIREESRY